MFNEYSMSGGGNPPPKDPPVDKPKMFPEE